MKKLTIYTTAMNAFEFEVPAEVAEKVVETFKSGNNFEMVDGIEKRTTVFANAHVVAIEVEG
ncbi:hypothetical protein EC99P2_00029 [Enterococcus phage EC99P2]|nr:hypothetical protein EC99P2_00029 [Enterococcus phage EC99P2]